MLQTLKSRLLALGATAAILGGTLGPVAVIHAQSSPPASQSASQETPDTANETANETAVESVEKGEPTLPGGGHADPAGTNTTHDFQGGE